MVVGRSASYSSLAAGSARVIPLGMACGEAAGVASAYAINHHVSVREMCGNETAMSWVQETLKAQGAYLEDFSIHEPIMDHWAYDGVKTLRAIGLLDGGYNNDYHLEEAMGKWRFQTMINGIAQKTDLARIGYLEVGEQPSNEEILSSCTILVQAKESSAEMLTYEEMLAVLVEREILNAPLLGYYTHANTNPQAAEVVQLCANVYRYLAEI